MAAHTGHSGTVQGVLGRDCEARLDLWHQYICEVGWCMTFFFILPFCVSDLGYLILQRSCVWFPTLPTLRLYIFLSPCLKYLLKCMYERLLNCPMHGVYLLHILAVSRCYFFFQFLTLLSWLFFYCLVKQCCYFTKWGAFSKFVALRRVWTAVFFVTPAGNSDLPKANCFYT